MQKQFRMCFHIPNSIQVLPCWHAVMPLLSQVIQHATHPVAGPLVVASTLEPRLAPSLSSTLPILPRTKCNSPPPGLLQAHWSPAPSLAQLPRLTCMPPRSRRHSASGYSAAVFSESIAGDFAFSSPSSRSSASCCSASRTIRFRTLLRTVVGSPTCRPLIGSLWSVLSGANAATQCRRSVSRCSSCCSPCFPVPCSSMFATVSSGPPQPACRQAGAFTARMPAQDEVHCPCL